jgi:hypothetical protein
MICEHILYSATTRALNADGKVQSKQNRVAGQIHAAAIVLLNTHFIDQPL